MRQLTAIVLFKVQNAPAETLLLMSYSGPRWGSFTILGFE